MGNYQGYKIQTFPNINDSPVAPTATAAGNGSHLIARYNEALDAIAKDISNLQATLLFEAILSYGLNG
jgi:hypothetical protein